MVEVTLLNFAAWRWRLILTDDAEEKAALEKQLEGTQAEAVDDYIETSCWSEDVPHLVGNKGTPAERLAALRAAYWKQKTEGAL